MGGLMICVSVVVSSLLWARPNIYVYTALIIYLGLTVIGFLDDYLKVSKANSKGLPGRWKLLGQAILTIIALACLLSIPESATKMRELWVPFYKDVVISEMSLFLLLPFLFLILSGSSNAINLTDGVDGLAIGCTVTVALAYAIMAYVAGNVIISDYLFISYIPGVGELAVVCVALLGASLAFLWYNSHPTEVFMGDTGSLALGGLIGMIAFMVHQPLTLIIVGGIFVMEAGSVILQVGSFKLRGGKRIFRMSPIHHHFELKGWHENKVVIRFWILSLIFAMAGLASLKLR
jgi:phospho-N-acetylmuramoyl-pentapeptide-transferase